MAEGRKCYGGKFESTAVLKRTWMSNQYQRKSNSVCNFVSYW